MSEQRAFDLGRVIAIAAQVVTQPIDFYRSMPRTGGYVEPAIFVAVMAGVVGLSTAVGGAIGSGGRTLLIGASAIIVVPIMAVVGSIVGAVVMFAIWKLMGSERSFEASYRCVAYASAIYPIVGVLSLLPYLGSMVGVAWGMYLVFTATIEVHAIPGGTARVVLGALAIAMLVTTVAGERASRRIESRFQQLSTSLGRVENMEPEEAGRKLGAFLRGLQEGSKRGREGREAREAR